MICTKFIDPEGNRREIVIDPEITLGACKKYLYGLVDTEGGDCIALNPITWVDIEGCRPGIACHNDCLELRDPNYERSGRIQS